jgi:hypothetical protein
MVLQTAYIPHQSVAGKHHGTVTPLAVFTVAGSAADTFSTLQIICSVMVA